MASCWTPGPPTRPCSSTSGLQTRRTTPGWSASTACAMWRVRAVPVPRDQWLVAGSVTSPAGRAPWWCKCRCHAQLRPCVFTSTVRCYKGSSSVPKTSPISPQGMQPCMSVVSLFLACIELPGNNSAPCLDQRGTRDVFSTLNLSNLSQAVSQWGMRHGQGDVAGLWMAPCPQKPAAPAF